MMLYKQAAVFSEDANGKKTTHGNKNNAVGIGNYATLEWIRQTDTRIDFGMHWAGADGAVDVSSVFAVWLYQQRGSQAMIHSLNGITGIPVMGVAWSAGTNAGTIKETFYRAGADPGVGATIGTNGIALLEIDNVDPGFGAFRIQDTDSADAGYPGPRYAFILSGTEFRIYRNYNAFLAQPPIFVIPTGNSGFPFPLTLVMSLGESAHAVRSVNVGAAAGLSTIYSQREQREDFANVTFTADSSTDVITSTAHPFSNSDEVRVANSGGGLPAPLVVNTSYFVRDATANTLKLSATQGGAAINLTSNGSGTNTLSMWNQNTFHLRLYQRGRFPEVPKGFPTDEDFTIV
jgi:hypothetical protein